MLNQSVVIMALSANELKFIAGLSQHMKQDEFACAETLAKDLIHQASEKKPFSLLVFPDGMGGDGVKVIEGLQSVLGDKFEIVGGFLGDDTAFSTTFQYFNGQVYNDAISALLLCEGQRFCTGM